MKGELRCPVCQARFRGAAECSRCSADLSALMLLAAHAYVLRQAARQWLRQGEGRTALAAIQTAQGLHATVEGSRLHLICNLLGTGASGMPQGKEQGTA